MVCILCLTTDADKMIDIFDEEGFSPNISEVITQHFWLQPNADEADAKRICCSCWNALDTFHQFYEQIRETHARMVEIKPIPSVDDKSDSDHFDTNSELVFPGCIKLQASDEDVNSDLESSKLTKVEKPSDSESDIPLSKISKWTCQTEDVKCDINESECDSLRRNKKQENKYNTSSSGGKKFNKKLVSCKQFDEIIEQNMTLSCHICHKSLGRFFILKHHYETVHNEVGYVTCCDKKFDSRYALAHHIMLHQNPDIFTCEKCGKALATNKSLRSHMKIHENEGKIHKCEKCGKSFSREKLERHMQTHQRVEQMCELCGKVTRDKCALRQHQLQKHSSIPRKRVPCKKCSVDFADHSGLLTHMKYLHPTTDVVHRCNICGKVSTTGYGLKRHIKYMHKSERRHKCTMCGKAFKMAQILREHMSTHTGEVLYTCPHCPKTFNSNANMHSHRKKMHRKEWEENRRYTHAVTAANTD